VLVILALTCFLIYVVQALMACWYIWRVSWCL
jgi:hypothetical protein